MFLQQNNVYVSGVQPIHKEGILEGIEQIKKISLCSTFYETNPSVILFENIKDRLADKLLKHPKSDDEIFFTFMLENQMNLMIQEWIYTLIGDFWVLPSVLLHEYKI